MYGGFDVMMSYEEWIRLAVSAKSCASKFAVETEKVLCGVFRSHKRDEMPQSAALSWAN